MNEVCSISLMNSYLCSPTHERHLSLPTLSLARSLFLFIPFFFCHWMLIAAQLQTQAFCRLLSAAVFSFWILEHFCTALLLNMHQERMSLTSTKIWSVFPISNSIQLNLTDRSNPFYKWNWRLCCHEVFSIALGLCIRESRAGRYGQNLYHSIFLMQCKSDIHVNNMKSTEKLRRMSRRDNCTHKPQKN